MNAQLHMKKAQPMIRIESLVLVVTLCAVSFALGLWAGEEQSAVQLKPCPKENGKVVAHRTAEVCTYIKTYGKATWERKI